MALQIFLSIAAVCWLFFVYTGIGCLLSRLCNVTFSSRLLKLLIYTALGFCVIGNLIMLFCFLQCATQFWIISLLLFFTITGAPFYKQVISDCACLVNNGVSVGRKANRLSFLLLILLVAGYAVLGLLPPTDFDALMYHLSTVKLYLEHGGFWNIYYNASADYPMLTEMNFMIGLALENDIICKTQSFLLGVMTMALIAYLCTYLFNDKGLIIPSLLIFCTFTVIIANMSNCDVDIPQALWTIIALIVLEKYLDGHKITYLLLASIVTGMALQTKTFGALAIPVMFTRIFIQRGGPLVTVPRIKEAAIVVSIPLLMGLPWYIKSYINNQTIFSIKHATIIGQGLGDPMGVQCASQACYWFFNGIIRVFGAPWTFSVFPGQHQGDTFGPLFIAILPFLFLVKTPKNIKIVLIAMGLFFAQILFVEMWFIQGGSSIRYSMFIVICATPLIVWTVRSMKQYPAAQKIVWCMIICMICMGSVLFIKRYHKEWLAFLTLQTRDEYYSRILPEYAVIKTINRLPENTVVMPLYNYSDYLLERPYITAYRQYASAEEMKKDFRQKNIGYIFANDKLDTSKNRNAFPEFTEKEIVDSANGFYLFKLAETY